MSFKIQQGLFKLDIVDRHAILGVPIDADGKQIRQRYLKVAYRLHPDTCKVGSDTQKKLANQILSKLVNPAYEHLSKDNSRTEHLLILTQMGKTIVPESTKTTVTSEPAKQLLQATVNTDAVYKKLLESLASEQYSSIDQILKKIAQISELNLVYLMLKQGQIERAKTSIPPSARLTTETASKKPATPEKETYISPVANYIRRAQEALNKNNPAQVIIEMRDAIKQEPNNSTCHGLMGLAYLRQNQLTMAKVHITKAWQANPQDPIAAQAKQELDRLIPPENPTKTASEPGKSGFLGGLFGGKKK
jgi:curved DNA-binding protein CbpA